MSKGGRTCCRKNRIEGKLSLHQSYRDLVGWALAHPTDL